MDEWQKAPTTPNVLVFAFWLETFAYASFDDDEFSERAVKLWFLFDSYLSGMIKVSLVDKYRPAFISDMVLPANHEIGPVSAFLENPYASTWFFAGRSGLGKTTLAEIIAARCGDPTHIRRLVGNDLDTHRVREIEGELRYRPLWGNFHVMIVNESDQITEGGQIRLLQLLETCQACIWVFTSNESLKSFDARFVSRMKCINFSAQGILEPATRWLMGVARAEGFDLTQEEASKSVRLSQNNLRTCLQELELKLLTLAPFAALKKPTAEHARCQISKALV